MFIYNYRLM